MNQSTDPPQQPHLVHLHRYDGGAVRCELAQGLLAGAADLHPRHLYDAPTSRQPEALTELAANYLTRTEAGIFAQHAFETMLRVAGFSRIHQ